jgi:hypothetical protein
MLRVLFYHSNDCLTQQFDTVLFLGIASLYLKTHIEINNPELAKELDWLLPIQKRLTDDEFVEYCDKFKPDIICSSHYIWNHTFLTNQLARVKNRISDKIILAAGGPSIDVNINSNFFKEHSFVDYAMYGAGEQAFADLIASLVTGKKLISFNTSNLAWFDKEKNKTIVADFKYVPQHKTSPFLHNVQMFSDMIKDMQDQNIRPVIPYELTRGCPYSCAFCDWNSGLSNKVTRRKGSYKDEIDLFQQLKIKYIYLSDANVGQYEEDVDMIRYFAEKNINENANFRIDGNYSKLRKDNNLKIYHLLGQSNLTTEYHGFTMSVQDINKEVLKNIDRPDVGWDVHLKIIYELRQAYPNRLSKVQVIQGLPGQTVDSWRATLSEICKHPLTLQPFVSELLPASPAARDKEYQKKFKFEYSICERYETGHFFKAIIPKSCFSFSQIDYVKMTIFTIFYSALLLFKSQTTYHFDIDEVVDDFLMSVNYKILVNDLYNNWRRNNKFYFTLDLDLKENLTSASNFTATPFLWEKSFFMVKLMSRYVQEEQKIFIKKMLQFKDSKIKTTIQQMQGFV